MPHLNADDFSSRLLDWHTRNGRKHLPWQRDRSPYRIWVSEIMLQQTQVATVIPYFELFIQRFDSIETLANASQDEVLHLWSGLGYYSRARNLHKAAKLIIDDHGGQFPQSLDKVMALPGIGRSTAGAILAFAFDQRHPILDGNVKRVLSRLLAIRGYPGTSKTSKILWNLADSLTPETGVARYTQAIMDLGLWSVRVASHDAVIVRFPVIVRLTKPMKPLFTHRKYPKQTIDAASRQAYWY